MVARNSVVLFFFLPPPLSLHFFPPPSSSGRGSLTGAGSGGGGGIRRKGRGRNKKGRGTQGGIFPPCLLPLLIPSLFPFLGFLIPPLLPDFPLPPRPPGTCPSRLAAHRWRRETAARGKEARARRGDPSPLRRPASFPPSAGVLPAVRVKQNRGGSFFKFFLLSPHFFQLGKTNFSDIFSARKNTLVYFS